MAVVPLPVNSYTGIFVITLLFAFLDGYSIGANDVANSFATSVGSRSLKLWQACCIAIFTEFLGAILLGASTTGTIKDGIARIQELEEKIPQVQFESILKDTACLKEMSNVMVDAARNFVDVTKLKTKGGFSNKRTIFNYQEWCIEVDETTFPFGTSWEVEIEHTDPERTKQVMTGLFKENGIQFKPALRSKYGTFLAGSF